MCVLHMQEDGNMEQGVGLALEQELLLFSAFVLKLNTW